jgi:hypothetical protein
MAIPWVLSCSLEEEIHSVGGMSKGSVWTKAATTWLNLPAVHSILPTAIIYVAQKLKIICRWFSNAPPALNIICLQIKYKAFY